MTVARRAVALVPGVGAVLTVLVLLALTFWLWWSALAEVMQQARERFEFRVSEVEFAIQQRLLAYEHVLRGGVGLFAASGDVTRDEWRTYVQSLEINRNYPGIQGFGFAKRVWPAQLENHIEQIRAEGFLDYALWPESDRAEYTAIVYLEPFDWRNQRAFGYDMFSEPVRHAAMARARDTGSAAMSGRVTLVQETGKAVQQGFLMYLPVYPEGVIPQTPEQRKAALVGYVYSPFRMADLMRGILGRAELPDTRLEIFDGSKASSDALMYDSQAGARPPSNPIFSTTKTVSINGSTWSLRFNSMPAFDAMIDRQKPGFILLSGTLVSGLVALLLWALVLNRRRRSELSCANDELQAEIAEREKLSQELERAKNAAEAANRAKSEFMANVSHELRTPLTLILAPLETLLSDVAVLSQWRTPLERIQRNALLLLGRVSEILDFAKAEAGKFNVRWQAVDLDALLVPLAEDAAFAARRRHCTLTCHIDPGLGAVCLDAGHFEKIAMNLVGNALKFTPDGGEIRLEACVRDQEFFEFSVANTGPGITLEDQALLFQRFQQGDTSATRRHGGTGLGLALVKELAELIGGSVGLKSHGGQGARFFVRLPRGTARLAELPARNDAHDITGDRENDTASLWRARFEDASAQAAEYKSTPHHFAAPAMPVVLVVDDTADMRAYIAELLAGEFEVLSAADGLQAWELLQSRRIDVVVADVMMPVLDGLGLTTRIKNSATLSHIPVILVTARGGADASVSGLQSGADDYVAKPFSPDELRARVRSALRMADIQMQLRDKSREAGMAMLATGIVHNLGNALNGVTVSTSLIQEKVRGSRVARLRKVVDLLEQHSDDLAGFLTLNSAGRLLPEFLARLSDHMEKEQAELLGEVMDLERYVEHATAVVGSHQRFTAVAGPEEMVSASHLMDMALQLSMATFDMEGVFLERRYDYTDALAVDRHKVLQILTNVMVNARQALQASACLEKRLSLRTACEHGVVVFEVSDNGIGIDAAMVPQLFCQGYTTKVQGHGLGLHLSASWAREMGGSLSCSSEGPGLGAVFTLELPGVAASSVQKTA